MDAKKVLIAVAVVLVASAILVLTLPLNFFKLNKVNASQPMDYNASDAFAASVSRNFTSSLNSFGFELFKSLQKEDANANVFISPFSISTALSMTYEAARGTTKDQMAGAMHLGGFEHGSVKANYFNIMQSLQNADQNIALSIANSIWIKSTIAQEMNQSYIDAMKKYYLSDVFVRDFSKDTVNEINQWVGQKTKGLIPKLIDDLKGDEVLILLNAVYFKGNWLNKFNPNYTKKEYFLANGAEKVLVDMMEATQNFQYINLAKFEAIRLPYGRDKIAMYVFLPHADTSFEDLAAELNYSYVESVMEKLAGMPKSRVEVHFPKFNITYGAKEINQNLIGLGMQDPFDSKVANFDGFVTQGRADMYISKVLHKAVIKVNEEGTEASGATAVIIGKTSFSPSETPKFIADRPFIFVIRDDRSGAILFIGALKSPV